MIYVAEAVHPSFPTPVKKLVSVTVTVYSPAVRSEISSVVSENEGSPDFAQFIV